MRLKTQLFLLSLSIGILIIIVFDVLFFQTSKKTIMNQFYHHLESVAELQKERIKRLVVNNYERLGLATNRPFLIESINQYIRTNDEESKTNIVISLLNIKSASASMKNIHIINTGGRVVISTDAKYINADYSKLSGYIKAMKGEKCIDGIFDIGNNKLGIHLSAPLYYKGEMVAILMIDSDGEKFEEALNDYTGLGETGETTLAKRDIDGSVIYLTSLRFDTDAALKRKVQCYDSYSICLAVSKKIGLFKNARDYRDKPVIAVTRYIEETGWGIETKIDREEALAPISETRRTILILSIVTGCIVFMVTWIFGNYITKPLNSLTHFAQSLKEGNYSKRLSHMPANEIGILAHTFNELVNKLELSNKEIEKNLTQLKQSNEALNNFAYTITHDLKSPLATVEGLIAILDIDKEKQHDEKNAQILLLIKEKVRHMTEMIINVLEYAKAGSSEKIEKELVDTNVLVKEVISSINPSENFQFTIKSDLPVVLYPKVPLIQVFQNLLSNAIKYMDKPEGKITIGCHDKNTHYEFYVEDNGPGIEEKNFDKIFLMLKKITKTRVESTGIGLATVKRIINENGGEIKVTSTPGSGTIFYFTILKSPHYYTK